MVKKYKVTIEETLRKTVDVEAESRAEAEQIANAEWYGGKHILTADNFYEVNFRAREAEKKREEHNR